MDIFGIGGWELVTIFIIMLVVAGPKRMIRWSYTLGKYVSQLRKMWSQTAAMLQKEFDAANIDIQVPKDIPTRKGLSDEVRRSLERAAKPVTQPVTEMTDELRDTAKAAGIPALTAANKPRPKPAPPKNGASVSSSSPTSRATGTATAPRPAAATAKPDAWAAASTDVPDTPNEPPIDTNGTRGDTGSRGDFGTWSS